MENLVPLPSWAATLFVMSVTLLCVIGVVNWLKKEKNISLPAMDTSKITFSSYCVISAVIIIGMAAYFFLTRSLVFDWAAVGISGGILLLAMLCTFPLTIEYDVIDAVSITGSIAVVLIVFVVMLFASMGFAALWLLITMALVIGGWFLKKKTN